MLGYVYVMSNVAMPGLYKIGCTSRNPYERVSDLNTTGVPTPFVVEYCINIDNYENIEKLIHKELSAYNFGKEFFQCDLEKCISSVKKIANRQSKYSESYRDQQIKAKVEGHDVQILHEQYKIQKKEYGRRLENEVRKNIENGMRKAIEIKKQEEKEYERINEFYKKLPNKNNIYALNYEQRVCARSTTLDQVRRNMLWSSDYKQNANISKSQNNIDNTKPSIYGDTSQQLYYYTTNKSNSSKASISAHSSINNTKSSIYGDTSQGARIKQIDRERKEQRAKEEQRHRDWLDNRNQYVSNSKQEMINRREQNASVDGDEIFVMFFIIILPLVIYLIMQ